MGRNNLYQVTLLNELIVRIYTFTIISLSNSICQLQYFYVTNFFYTYDKSTNDTNVLYMGHWLTDLNTYVCYFEY